MIRTPVTRILMWGRTKAAVKLLLGQTHKPTPIPVRLHTLEDQVFCAIISAKDVVYDIGANRGVTAVLFARLAGPEGKVYAFEPSMRNYRGLCEYIQTRTDSKATIETFPVGVSDTTGPVELHVPHDQPAMASLRLSERAQKIGSDSARLVEQVHCIRLDEFIDADWFERPNFIKIDVEGAEMLVLRGARRLLTSTLPVLHVEVFAPWLIEFGIQPINIFDELSAYGYEFLFACPEGLVRHPPSTSYPFPLGFERGYNVVAVIPARHAVVIKRLERLYVGRPGLLPVPPPPCPNVVTGHN